MASPEDLAPAFAALQQRLQGIARQPQMQLPPEAQRQLQQLQAELPAMQQKLARLAAAAMQDELEEAAPANEAVSREEVLKRFFLAQRQPPEKLHVLVQSLLADFAPEPAPAPPPRASEEVWEAWQDL